MVMRIMSLVVYVIDFMNISICVYCVGMDTCVSECGRVKETVFLERKALEKLWQRGSYLPELLRIYHRDDILQSRKVADLTVLVTWQ